MTRVVVMLSQFFSCFNWSSDLERTLMIEGKPACSNQDVVYLVQLKLEVSTPVNLTDDVFPEDGQHQPAVRKLCKTLRLYLAHTVSKVTELNKWSHKSRAQVLNFYQYGLCLHCTWTGLQFTIICEEEHRMINKSLEEAWNLETNTGLSPGPRCDC